MGHGLETVVSGKGQNICMENFARRSLPCRAVLANRHMKVDAICPAWKSNVDTIKHMLFKCKLAKDLCSLLGAEDVIEKACLVDHAGSGVMGFSLADPDLEVSVIGQACLRNYLQLPLVPLVGTQKVNTRRADSDRASDFLDGKISSCKLFSCILPKAKLRTEGCMELCGSVSTLHTRRARSMY